jgi:hypothetical protein
MQIWCFEIAEAFVSHVGFEVLTEVAIRSSAVM